MRWEFSPEQADFRSVLADWLADRCGPEQLRGWLDAGDHAAFGQQFAADGWFGVGSVEDLGGEGGGLVELAIAAEELGRRAAPASAWLGCMLAMPALAAIPMAAKSMLADGVITVPAIPAGRAPDAAATVGVQDGHLTGTVPVVLAASAAKRLVVPVARVSETDATGTTLCLVETDQPGVRLRWHALTDRGRSVADVELVAAVGTPIPADDVAAVLGEVALRSAVLIAADALGVMEYLLDTTVEYVRQRKQFGVPIGSFQAVKHAAAEMLVKVEAARSIVYLAAASVEAGHPDAPLHAAAAKAQVCAAAAAAADSALMLHGAIGYTWEHDLQIFYKRAKLDAELFGSPAVWNERLADQLGLIPG